MKLFRALPKDENELNSDERAFQADSMNPNLIILDEVYSHIIPSHKLSQASARRVIYSFTDDIDVADMLVKKYPQTYSKIGCINVNLTEESSAFAAKDENIFCVKPVFRLADWIDMAAYKINKSEEYSGILTVDNTNYAQAPIPLINILVPSRWGALSLARSYREYAVICRDIVPAIFTEEEIEAEKSEKKVIDYDLLLLDDVDTKRKVIESLISDLKTLDISEAHKEYLLRRLNDRL